MLELQTGIIDKNSIIGILKPIYRIVRICPTEEEIKAEKERMEEFYKTHKVSACCIPVYTPEINDLKHKYVIVIYFFNNESAEELFDNKEEADKKYSELIKIVFNK